MPSTTKEVSMKENIRARALWSKENIRANGEMGETSFRVYYGANGAAVPFIWESRPGTPKHPMFNSRNDDIVPPLTPPPSYTTTNNNSLTIGHTSSRRRKSRIFDVFLSSFSRKNNSDVSPTSSSSSPLSWSNSSSSSSSSISSPRLGGRKSNSSNKSHRRSISFCSFGGKSPVFGEEIDDNIDRKSSNTAMCFGFKKNSSMQDMKNAIFSIKGH